MNIQHWPEPEQHSQKCPGCGDFLLAGQLLDSQGGWTFHVECGLYLVDRASFPIAIPWVDEADSYARVYHCQPEDLHVFENWGLCRGCTRIRHVNTITVCVECWLRQVKLDNS